MGYMLYSILTIRVRSVGRVGAAEKHRSIFPRKAVSDD